MAGNKVTGNKVGTHTTTQHPLVLHIAPTPFFADRGCHIRIEGIAKSLEQLGYDNLVCTYHHGRDVDGVNTSRISTIRGYTQTEAGPSKYKLWADWKLLWLVIKEINRAKPKVIHAHLHEGLMIGLVAKTLLFWKRIPMVADMQGSLTGELTAHGTFKKHPWLRWPTKLIERTLMMCAKTIVCSSPHSLAKLTTDFGLDETNVSLVQDGANPAPAISDKDSQRLRAQWSLPEDKTVVVYSGALLNGKGLNELKQLILLSQQEDNIHFLIIGYPTENLRPFLEQHSLQPNVTLTGRVEFEHLPALLSLADISVDPKAGDSGEGSGKMLNYLACGLPVLAFDSVNNKNFLPQHTLLATSTNNLFEHLLRWHNNPAQRQQSGQENLAHFLESHSWQQTVRQLDTVYQAL